MTQQTQRGLLLDTCALLWLFGDSPMRGAVRQAIDEAASSPVLQLSPISIWELGMLVAKSRVALSMPPEQWVDHVLDSPSVQQAAMTSQILLDSSFLPGNPPRDPADRIIISTARHLSLAIVTRDQPILDYAEQGHVAAQAC